MPARSAGAVPRPERERRLLEGLEGHGAGGLPVHPGGVRQPGEHRRLERAEHAPLARRRRRAAARREGNREAGPQHRSEMVFQGKLDIPVIDWRHYLEHRLDAQLAPVVRRAAALLNYDGDASNQLIWFTDARPGLQSDQTPQAFLVLDEWIKTGQAGDRKRRMLRDQRDADRERPRRVGQDPERGACGRLHAGVPSTRRRGSSPAARSRAVSSSAPSSPSSGRSRRASTGRGSRPRPTSTA